MAQLSFILLLLLGQPSPPGDYIVTPLTGLQLLTGLSVLVASVVALWLLERWGVGK